MASHRANIVADGAQNLRRAGNYDEQRRQMWAELFGGSREKRGSGSVWRRLAVQIARFKARRTELQKNFPPTALHFGANPPAGRRAFHP